MPQDKKPLCLIQFPHFLPLLPPSFLPLQYKELVYDGELGKKEENVWD